MRRSNRSGTSPVSGRAVALVALALSLLLWLLLSAVTLYTYQHPYVRPTRGMHIYNFLWPDETLDAEAELEDLAWERAQQQFQAQALAASPGKLNRTRLPAFTQGKNKPSSDKTKTASKVGVCACEVCGVAGASAS